MKILTIQGMVLLLLVGITAPAQAGVPPDPWRVNQLNSVVNVLEAVDHELEAVLGTPPDPYKPGSKGIIGHLSAITRQLWVQLGRVEAVLGIPPDPYAPEFEEFVKAVERVNAAASGIVERVTSVPPDPYREELTAVLVAAQAIVVATTP